LHQAVVSMKLLVCLSLGCIFSGVTGPVNVYAANKNFENALLRGNRAVSEGNYDQAEKQANIADKIQSATADVANLQGQIAAGRHHFDEAIKDYNVALKRRPDFNAAKYNLGRAELLKGDYTAAVKIFEDLKKVDPKSELVDFNMVMCYLLRGDDPHTRTALGQMIFPGVTPAYYYAHAAFYQKKQKKDQVKSYIDRAHQYYNDEQCDYFLKELKLLKLM
jgi:tetratricopeptide (TPR) repeat protein